MWNLAYLLGFFSSTESIQFRLEEYLDLQEQTKDLILMFDLN